MKINIGAGDTKIPGYVSIDRKDGQEAFPLAYADNSVEEVRASHVLEHFPQNDGQRVVNEWARVLQPGGCLKIAVPDFDKVVCAYQRGESLAISYLLGGQRNENDFHRSVYTASHLGALLQNAGLVDIKPWESDFKDCSALPISLNLQGTKPPETSAEKPTTVRRNIQAVISVPRIGWNDTWGCINASLMQLRITLRKGTGVFWGHVLTELMEAAIADGADYILAIDYDSVFQHTDILRLVELMELYPEAAAMVPLQCRREREHMLFGIMDNNGEYINSAPADIFDNDVTEISTGHFGLTVLRASALQRMRDEGRVWFKETPGPKGNYGEGCIHPDIHFWIQMREMGLKVFLANDVKIGHLQLMISWPDKDFKQIHQPVGDWGKNGPPKQLLKQGVS